MLKKLEYEPRRGFQKQRAHRRYYNHADSKQAFTWYTNTFKTRFRISFPTGFTKKAIPNWPVRPTSIWQKTVRSSRTLYPHFPITVPFLLSVRRRRGFQPSCNSHECGQESRHMQVSKRWSACERPGEDSRADKTARCGSRASKTAMARVRATQWWD